jgi:hypothetical protein
VAFAFVLGDLIGGLILGWVNDEPELRRHALRGRRVGKHSERDEKNGCRDFAHDGYLIASEMNGYSLSAAVQIVNTVTP